MFYRQTVKICFGELNRRKIKRAGLLHRSPARQEAIDLKLVALFSIHFLRSQFYIIL